QDDIALEPQAAYPCDPTRDIEHLKKGRISLGSRKALHKLFHPSAVLVVDGQCPLAIQAQASLASLTLRTAVKKVSAAALPQSPQQVFDHPTGRGTFDPSRLAVRQCGGVGLQKDGAQVQCKVRLDLQGVGANQHAGEETRHVPRTRRQYGFVKIIQVKV